MPAIIGEIQVFDLGICAMRSFAGNVMCDCDWLMYPNLNPKGRTPLTLCLPSIYYKVLRPSHYMGGHRP